jgi:ABC-2 type transport system permease protein
VLGVLAATVTIAMFGFLLSVVAVRYRTAWALGASLEYPGWLLCGFVVPVALLPVALHPLSYALAPTWAVEAMRSAAAGGSPWAELGICLALGVGYAALAAYLGVRLIESARRNATLALT